MGRKIMFIRWDAIRVHRMRVLCDRSRRVSQTSGLTDSHGVNDIQNGRRERNG